MAVSRRGDGVMKKDKVLRAPELKKKTSQSLTGPMAYIYVGVERKIFKLHLDLLCEKSELFRAAFGGDFQGAEAKELSLPGDSVESFELLVEWLYGASLSIPSEDDFLAYLDLYILANKLCMEHLQNETMDYILRFYRLHSPKVAAQKMRAIYDNTSAEAPLCRLIVNSAAWTAASKDDDRVVLDPNDRDLLEGGGQIAVTFTSMLAGFCVDAKGDRLTLVTTDPRKSSNCSYHQHNSTPVCEDSPSEATYEYIDWKDPKLWDF